MCDLTVADFSPAEKREALRRELARDVREARGLALLTQSAWIDAMRDLDDATITAITRATMVGDAAGAGRLLRNALQRSILATATSRARDVFDARHDSSADALWALYAGVTP